MQSPFNTPSKYDQNNVDINGGTIDGVTATYAMSQITKASSGAVSSAECYGTLMTNYGQAGDATLTLPAAASGLSFIWIAGTAIANYMRFDPDAGDSIYLDGVTTGDGKYVGLASVAIGDGIQFIAVQTGASAFDWIATSGLGAWSAEA